MCLRISLGIRSPRKSYQLKERLMRLFYSTYRDNTDMESWISSINLLAAVYSKEEEVRYRFWRPRRTDKPSVGSIERMVCEES